MQSVHNKSILIVDDDPVIRDVMQIILHAPGIEFSECDTFDAARAMLESRVFDVVILDNQLPGGLGLDLIPLAKKRAGKVILVTADYVRSGLAEQAMERGAAAVLTKPFGVWELQTLVE